MFKIFKKSIIFFLIFFLIFISFFLFWKCTFTVNKKNSISLTYTEIIKKISLDKTKNLNEVESFIINNKNIYGTLTAMLLTKKYILSNDLDRAYIQLKNGLKYTKEDNLKNILKLRMAKIKIQKNENKTAINILESIQNYHFKNIIENMKGDIFMKQNNVKLAIEHWKKSLLTEDLNASKEIINMKINEFEKQY